MTIRGTGCTRHRPMLWLTSCARRCPICSSTREVRAHVARGRRSKSLQNCHCPFCTATSPANRHSRNSDFKFVLKLTEYFKGTLPLKANFVQQFLDFNCFEGNVGEACERRGGEHNYGLFRAHRFHLELSLAWILMSPQPQAWSSCSSEHLEDINGFSDRTKNKSEVLTGR